MRIASVLLLLVGSGCLAAVPAVDVTPSQTATTAPGPATFEAENCVQYHMYFTTPGDSFKPFLPDGFSLATNEAGVFDLRIEATDCPATEAQPASTQIWIELPVIPPGDVAVPEHMSFLPIEAYFAPEQLRSSMENASVPLAQGCHCAVTNLAADPVLIDEIVSHSLAGSYELRAAMSPDSGPFGDEQLARYIAHDGELVGVMLGSTTNAINRGVGTVQFQYTGPGGAPPVHQGIVHAVIGVTLDLQMMTPGLQQSL